MKFRGRVLTMAIVVMSFYKAFAITLVKLDKWYVSVPLTLISAAKISCGKGKIPDNLSLIIKVQ